MILKQIQYRLTQIDIQFVHKICNIILTVNAAIADILSIVNSCWCQNNMHANSFNELCFMKSMSFFIGKIFV